MRTINGIIPDPSAPVGKGSAGIVVDVDDPTKERECQRCGCTEDNACQAGLERCAWACESIDLCTHCIRAGEILDMDHLAATERGIAALMVIQTDLVTIYRETFAAEAREGGR